MDDVVRFASVAGYVNGRKDFADPTQPAQQAEARAHQSHKTWFKPFPERDPGKPAEQQGIFRKFTVMRMDRTDDPGEKHHGCRYFVLDLTHDQHAPAAMRAYAKACEVSHPKLAEDIRAEYGPFVAAQPADDGSAA